MQKLTYILFTLTLLLAPPAFGKASPEIAKKHNQMLYTAVMVKYLSSAGSGTLVYSQRNEGAWDTFILTNYHVVQGAITVSKEWDPQKKKEIDKERRQRIRVFWFDYNDLSKFVGTRGKSADIVAYDKPADLALLKLRDKEKGVTPVAIIRHPCRSIHLFEEVWAVGAGLGRPPFATKGHVSFLREEVDGYPYTFTTAPIIFGNSGGSLFRQNGKGNYELIGVPSKVATTFFQAVSHIGLSIPMETVQIFLKDNKYDYIFPKGCKAAKVIILNEEK